MATSSEYETFIYGICQALGEPNRIIVHRNKVYTGRLSGRDIRVDVSFEGHLLGAHILGLVECKCYKSRVEVSDVEEFHSKLDDIGAHKGIMFTTVGYESGAKKVAKGRGIALFTLREGQEAGELRIETKSANRPAASSFLKGNFLPWGRFAESDDEPSYRVESADELFYLLAFSEDERFAELARQQGRG